MLLICCGCFRYSSCRSFKQLLNEVNDLAGQHEVISENLQANVIRELTALVKDMREERKVGHTNGFPVKENMNLIFLVP